MWKRKGRRKSFLVWLLPDEKYPVKLEVIDERDTREVESGRRRYRSRSRDRDSRDSQ